MLVRIVSIYWVCHMPSIILLFYELINPHKKTYTLPSFNSQMGKKNNQQTLWHREQGNKVVCPQPYTQVTIVCLLNVILFNCLLPGNDNGLWGHKKMMKNRPELECILDAEGSPMLLKYNS